MGVSWPMADGTTGASRVTERPNLGGFSTEATLSGTPLSEGALGVDWGLAPAANSPSDAILDEVLTVAERLFGKPAVFEGYAAALAYFSPPAAAHVKDRLPGAPDSLLEVVEHRETKSVGASRKVVEFQTSGRHEAAIGFLRGWLLLDISTFGAVVPPDLAAQARLLG